MKYFVLGKEDILFPYGFDLRKNRPKEGEDEVITIRAKISNIFFTKTVKKTTTEGVLTYLNSLFNYYKY